MRMLLFAHLVAFGPVVINGDLNGSGCAYVDCPALSVSNAGTEEINGYYAALFTCNELLRHPDYLTHSGAITLYKNSAGASFGWYWRGNFNAWLSGWNLNWGGHHRYYDGQHTDSPGTVVTSGFVARTTGCWNSREGGCGVNPVPSIECVSVPTENPSLVPTDDSTEDIATPAPTVWTCDCQCHVNPHHNTKVATMGTYCSVSWGPGFSPSGCPDGGCIGYAATHPSSSQDAYCSNWACNLSGSQGCCNSTCCNPAFSGTNPPPQSHTPTPSPTGYCKSEKRRCRAGCRVQALMTRVKDDRNAKRRRCAAACDTDHKQCRKDNRKNSKLGKEQ